MVKNKVYAEVNEYGYITAVVRNISISGGHSLRIEISTKKHSIQFHFKTYIRRKRKQNTKIRKFQRIHGRKKERYKKLRRTPQTARY
jgi:hypothetical protein